MAEKSDNDLVFSDFRGGRNGVDSPLILPETQCAEAKNVEWEDGPLGNKRPGATVVTTGALDLSAGVYSMYRHVPDGDETLAEWWVVTVAGVVARLTTSGWAAVTLDDAISSRPQDVCFCTFNGKLYMAYDSAVDRLHVFDPALNLVRKVGMSQPAAPTSAQQGAGTYTGSARLYRVRYIQYNGTTVSRRSEPSSASATITPDGAHSAIRVTKPATLSEHETHWEIEVSIDGGDEWWVLAGVAEGNPILVATTTFDDSTADADYLDLATPEEVGSFTLPTSVKYLATDGNHLLMAGAWESGNKTSRIWYTPALGASDHGDDERIILTDAIKGYLDLNEKDGGMITGLSNPVGGTPCAFKYRQSWKLIPTGAPENPWIPRKISDAVGCIFFKTIVVAENAAGDAIVAWASHKGIYQFGPNGLLKMSRDVDDVWFGKENTEYEDNRINLEASIVVAHAIYHTDKHQLWFFIARGSYNSPDVKLMCDVRRNVGQDQYGLRGGWAVHEGQSCKAVCSVMFANTTGASMSRDLKPYVGYLLPS